MAAVVFYGVLWAEGANDVLADFLQVPLYTITWISRVLIFVGPIAAYFITKRICLGLQRKDKEMLLHGYESGIIMRDAQGGYTEKHLPLDPDNAYTLTARERDVVYAGVSGPDENGVDAPHGKLDELRAKASHAWFADNVQKPTQEELEEGHHHAEHEHELQAPMEGHAADGHQFDGHHLVEGEKLRADD